MALSFIVVGAGVYLVLSMPEAISATEADALNNRVRQSEEISRAVVSQVDAGVKTVFIGDSYTHGTGSSATSKRWTSLVSESRGWTEDNLGRGGTGYLTTSGPQGCGLENCPNYDQMVPLVVAAAPARVVVAGGQNDFQADFATVLPMITATYADLRAALPSVEIIAVGPSVIGDVSAAVLEFDAAVQKAAAAVGARYISLINPDVLDPEMATAGSAHVDDAGHAAIAAAVLAGLAA